MSTEPLNSTAEVMPPPLESGHGREPLIAIRDLKVHFNLGGGSVWDKPFGRKAKCRAS